MPTGLSNKSGLAATGASVFIGANGWVGSGTGWSAGGGTGGGSGTVDLDFSAGRLPSGVTITRSGTAWAFNSAGVLTSYPANTPRFGYDMLTLAPLGLLVEGTRTNSLRNSTMVGGVAGSPGTMPTNWWSGNTTTSNGLTRTIVGFGVEDGIEYMDLRWDGTAAANGTRITIFDGTTQVPASLDQVWIASAYVKLMGGSLANTNVTIFMVGTTSAGATNEFGQLVFVPTSNPPLRAQRWYAAKRVASPLTAFATTQLHIGANAGAVIDITLRIGLPQLELAEGAGGTVTASIAGSSPIKTLGSAAVSRAADVCQITQILTGQAVVVSGRASSGPPSPGTAVQSIFGISDRTTDNYKTLLRTGGTNVVPRCFDNTVDQINGVDLGVIANDTDFTASVRYAPNNFAATINGGPLRTDLSGTVPAAATVGQLGATPAGDYWFSTIKSFKTMATATDGELQAVSSGVAVQSWVDAVVANGGTVSAARQAIVESFVKAEMLAGAWNATDDYWPLWGENAIQSLTSLKQRRLATVVAAPVYTPNRGYLFNGTTSYINTGFIGSTHSGAMFGTNQRLAVYEHNEFNTGSAVSIGAFTAATTLSSYMMARTGSGVSSRLNTGGNNTFSIASAIGYTATSRNGDETTVKAWKNGVELTRTGTQASLGGTLPTFSYFIGALNNNGTAGFFRPSDTGFACVGASLTPEQELAQYNNVRAFALAIGTITDDPDAQAWMDQVVVNGGTVSASRLKIVTDFIKAEKAAGSWALTDDYMALWGENAIQGLTSLKQRRLSVEVATPLFVPDRGYTFDGVANYLDSGFIPASHAVALNINSLRLAIYERTNVNTNTWSAGGQTGGVPLSIIARAGAVTYAGLSSLPISTPSPTSLGLSVASRDDSFTHAFYKNGIALTPVKAGAIYTTLPSNAIWIGCVNRTGSAQQFRAASIGFFMVGAQLTQLQEALQYQNVQAWATAIGANV